MKRIGWPRIGWPRIGWIGCGMHAGEMLLPQLVRLAAIADVNPERLALIGDRYGVPRRYADGVQAMRVLQAMTRSMASGAEEPI